MIAARQHPAFSFFQTVAIVKPGPSIMSLYSLLVCVNLSPCACVVDDIQAVHDAGCLIQSETKMTIVMAGNADHIGTKINATKAGSENRRWGKLAVTSEDDVERVVDEHTNAGIAANQSELDTHSSLQWLLGPLQHGFSWKGENMSAHSLISYDTSVTSLIPVVICQLALCVFACCFINFAMQSVNDDLPAKVSVPSIGAFPVLSDARTSPMTVSSPQVGLPKHSVGPFHLREPPPVKPSSPIREPSDPMSRESTQLDQNCGAGGCQPQNLPNERPLCEELVVPQNSECLLIVPRLNFSNDSQPVSVIVDDVRGMPVFRATLSPITRSSLGSIDRMSISDSRCLTLASADGDGLFAIARNDRKSIALYTHSEILYGNLEFSEASNFVFSMISGGKIMFTCNETIKAISVLSSDDRKLAIVEPPKNGDLNDPRSIVVGPGVDVGVILLCLFGIDWLNGLMRRSQ
eukprot:TRINITY_DN67911_c0_g1_i1.p1 TRINITY_DN67911_c0_g1~~TRINITY_DN67911_c0_g1_i1.p1  ORF type:complete len:463 (-),score=39.24 TRINITY_DN67911_c0_g1_i1:34-1422(-)